MKSLPHTLFNIASACCCACALLLVSCSQPTVLHNRAYTTPQTTDTRRGTAEPATAVTSGCHNASTVIININNNSKKEESPRPEPQPEPPVVQTPAPVTTPAPSTTPPEQPEKLVPFAFEVENLRPFYNPSAVRKP